MALPREQTSAVGVDVSVGGTSVSVGTGVSVGGVGVSVGGVGVSVGGVDVSVGDAGVSVGGVDVSVGDAEVSIGVDVSLIPGIINSPSSTLKPPDIESMRLVPITLISGPKAIKVPIPTRETRVAMSEYSTSPCPFSFFLAENF
jgi:hypothetical protein